MSFLRPKVTLWLKRWQEALLGFGFVLFGLWLVLTSYGIGLWAGFGFLILGFILVLTGLRRGRLYQTELGPGVVEIVEGRMTYLGPFSGGTIDLDDLCGIAFTPSQTGPGMWVLHSHAGKDLSIPENAYHVELLLDAWAALPGFDMGAMLRVQGNKKNQSHQVWTRPAHKALT